MKKIISVLFTLAFSATILGQEIDLAWDDTSTNEAGFIIERKDGDGTFVQIASLEANETIYQDTTFPIGSVVSYRIYAHNQFGDSPYSNVITIDTSVPSAPGNFRFNFPSGVVKALRKIFGPNQVLEGEYNTGNNARRGSGRG